MPIKHTKVMCRYLSILLFISGLLACEKTTAQSSSSFEMRYFTDDPKANGETDFRGETEVFNTDQRIEFLRHYAGFSKKFFQDEQLDFMVVSGREAGEVARRIKPQPLPEHRDRMVLDQWKWRGYREGMEKAADLKLQGYENSPGISVQNGSLVTTSNKTRYTWEFPSQGWRFSFSWKAKVPSNEAKAAFVFSESGEIAGSEVGFGSNGRFYYTTANNETVEASEYMPDKWYDFKIEFDLAAIQRQDFVRYNLYINGERVADYVPLQRVVTGGVGYAQHFNSIAGINRMGLDAGKGVQIDDIWGVGYRLTGRESYPYFVETFLDEHFDTVGTNQGWQTPGFNDRSWAQGSLPIVHGSERHEGEDLYLRKIVRVGDFDKAYLNIETLDPGGEVWVNGRVAAVVSDRSPQRIDLSSFLHKNDENIIGVKVNHFYLKEGVGEIMPHSSLDFNIGWFAGRMTLDLLPLTSIDDVFVHTRSLSADKALESVRVKLENKYWLAFRGTLEASMYPWFPEESSEAVAATSADLLLPHNRSITQLTLEVSDPDFWTPEHPHLYKLQVVLKDEKGNIIDDHMTTTGIRTVSQEGGSFRLNGRVSMLNGAQIMGFRAPLEDMVIQGRCAPSDWIAREILQVKKMNGNLLRVHVHHWEFPARGINDPRYAEFADQLGIMLIWCPTAWIRTGRGWGDVDFEHYPDYMQQVINHPSIVIWEVANHTQSFKGRPVSESDIFCEQAYNTIYPVDPSRLISYNSHIAHLHYGNDEGTIDQTGNRITPGWAWTAPNVTRGNQDSPTGYGKTWTVLREYPGAYRVSFLNSRDRAYFNFEHEESIAQPNWNLVKGKPWYHLQSYEWSYDEGSIGRRLTLDEWQESQAWQAFSAWEAMKKMRCLDYDGFSWCCLHGGANSVTYKKPLIDFTGHAKLAWHVNKMVFQHTVAGTGNVDVAIGPEDRIEPVVINWDDGKKVDLTVRILDAQQREVASRVYRNVELEAGRTVKMLEGFKPEGLKEGFYFLVFEIN
jgi:hypothetical protein